MIILGKNPDDIGCQLERLTKKILEHKGYTNITVNEISSGGHEIDVTANFTLPVPGKSQSKRLIAECKAHKTPISIPDWLKFLGKIYLEEVKTNGEVNGLFVALSGVNGNVAGSFNELSQRKDNISILSGDALLHEVTKIYNIFSRQKTIECFEKLTSHNYLNIEALYYEEQIYWMFTFSNDEYTILSCNGSPITELQTIHPLIEKTSSLSQIVDLGKEAEAIARKTLLQKTVLSLIAIRDEAIGIDEIGQKLIDFNSDEIHESVNILKNKGWIDEKKRKYSILNSNIKSTRCYDLFCEIIHFFFKPEIQVKIFIEFYSSPFVLKRFNKFFLRHISKIQGNLPFTEELKKNHIRNFKNFPRGSTLFHRSRCNDSKS